MTMAQAPEDAAPVLLLIACPDRVGLVHDVTGVVGRRGGNIVSNSEFVDRGTRRFFMRTEFTGGRTAGLIDEVTMLVPEPASVRLGRRGQHRIVVLATREPHCLGELLIRQANGELGATIAAVVSNHDALETLTRRFDVPFHAVSHEGRSREAHEEAIVDLTERYAPDYLVLARYMRILSPGFVRRYAGRIVNIHHSFLPAFTGPSPYRQAFVRGVKIIGATAHFVTEGLDEGPIIAQAVVPVDHGHQPADMAQAGRDIEKIVLARALHLVFDERVFVHAGRTVVFE